VAHRCVGVFNVGICGHWTTHLVAKRQTQKKSIVFSGCGRGEPCIAVFVFCTQLLKDDSLNIKTILFLFFGVISANESRANSLEVEMTLPKMDVSPYHKPYVAVWLETTKRKPVKTFVFWREQSDWFKDLRQWWRKVGRNETPNYDAVSGATRKPGTYTFDWQVSDLTGEFVLHFEAVREQGSREYLKQKINLGQTQTYFLQGNSEFGEIKIDINQE